MNSYAISLLENHKRQLEDSIMEVNMEYLELGEYDSKEMRELSVKLESVNSAISILKESL